MAACHNSPMDPAIFRWVSGRLPLLAQRMRGWPPTTTTAVGSKAMPRLEVRVSEDLQRDLDAFAREDETTRNEIIRRAMALYAHARAEVNQGGAVILQSPEGTTRQIVAL